MTSTSRSHPKLFSSFLLPATILTVALLAFVPVVFGQAGSGVYAISGIHRRIAKSTESVHSGISPKEHQHLKSMFQIWS